MALNFLKVLVGSNRGFEKLGAFMIVTVPMGCISIKTMKTVATAIPNPTPTCTTHLSICAGRSGGGRQTEASHSGFSNN